MNIGHPRLAVGHCVGGRFQVAAFLGAGELGEVYDVRDLSTQYAYALKLYSPELLQRPEVIAALRVEAEKAAATNTAGVAKAYEFDVEPAVNAPYMLGEYVTIPSLAARIANEGPLSIPTVESILRAVAATLDAAHAVGLVHRAIKPTNLFAAQDVEQTGNVRITDFGIAAARILAPPPPGWTATPGWLSADQADPSTPPSPTMDVYALGLVAFYALTGMSPFLSCRKAPPDLGMLWAEMTAPMPPASQRARELGVLLSPTLDPWFGRALSVSPSQRFKSVGEMSRALFALVGSSHHVATIRPTGVPGPSPQAQPPLATVPLQPQAFPPQPQAFPPQPQAEAESVPATPQPSHSDFSSDQPASAPTDSLPPKKSSLLIPLVLGGALAGIAVLGVLVWFGYSRYKAADLASTAPTAVASSPPAETASVAPAASSAPPAAETASAAPPPEVPDAGGATPPEVPKDAVVKFECKPACDEVKCDNEAVSDPSGGTRLAAGRHTCVAKKEGYVALTQSFVVKAGNDTTKKFTLPKLPTGGGGGTFSAPPAKTCGTFLNPCK